MITAVDTSILLDVLTNDPKHAEASLHALRSAGSVGGLIVCPIVWAELRAFFESAERMTETLAAAHVSFDPFDRTCADVAGASWREYRKRGGSRARLIPDFFIGAHAQQRGGRLLTRDRGFYRRYFTSLTILN